jgi:hypothetical protein
MLKLWRWLQRRIDVLILWPTCKKQTHDRLSAEQVFRLHMEMDPAYSDMDFDDKMIFVKNLPW